MADRTKNHYILLFLVGLFFLTAYALGSLLPRQDDLNSIRSRIQEELINQENWLEEFAGDPLRYEKYLLGTYSAGELSQLKDRPVKVYIYRNGELVFWSSNEVVLSSIEKFSSGSTLTEQRNGWFIAVKQKATLPNAKDVVVLGLIPVKKDYPIRNRYLRSGLDAIYDVPDWVDCKRPSDSDAFIVRNKSGKPMFSLQSREVLRKAKPHWAILVLNACGFLILCLFIHFLSLRLIRRYNWYTGFGFLVLSIILIRILMIYMRFPAQFAELNMFSPALYASSMFTSSLGGLLINFLFLLWAVAYWFYHVRDTTSGSSGHHQQIAGVFFQYFLVFVAVHFIERIIRSMVIDSVIPYELNNFMELTPYSFVGLFIIAVVLLTFFVLSYGMVQNCIRLCSSTGSRFAAVLVAGGLFVLLRIWFQPAPITLFLAVWTVGYLILTDKLFRRGSFLVTYSSLVFLTFFFSVLTAFLLESNNRFKHMEARKTFAATVADQEDEVTEFLVRNIKAELLDDDFIHNFIGNPHMSLNDLTDRVSKKYLRGVTSKYDVEVLAFNRDGMLTKSSSDVRLATIERSIETLGREIDAGYLYYVSDETGNYHYLIRLPVEKSNLPGGTILIRLLPKVYKSSNVYPELLLEEKLRQDQENKKYIYAVYANNELVSQNGSYPFSTYYEGDVHLAVNSYAFEEDGSHEHLIYRYSQNKYVIVTWKRENILMPVAIFSYVYCFLVIFSFLIGILYAVYRNAFSGNPVLQTTGISFRNRITFSMIFIIIVSFVIIGVVTVRYFTLEYEDYHQERLLRKENAVLSALEYHVHGNEKLNKADATDTRLIGDELEERVSNLADIHTMDINLYSTRGDLMVTSQPDIFAKGLLSEKMDPLAFHNISKIEPSQHIQNESIGLLEYMSVYVPVRNREREIIALLNLPYFAQAENLREDISSFMVALVNVYVFLLVCAGFIAFFISNSITRPLTQIGDKLRLVKLGKKNEPIEWKTRDEIGTLVDEYNKMILELEKSVEMLSKSERESAWREMAKQIAHEIKNPLTPMKLSIQYLQKALDENSPDANELAKRVTNTLIEQIDNLSEIATAFSSFAKMPRARNERLQLSAIVRSVVHLFKDDPQVAVLFESRIDDAEIIADKNQLMRAFNNLIKNAAQAIPEDKAGQVKVTVGRKGNNFLVQVQDNGVGISEEFRDKVFVPNFTTKSSGTGLGLAITKQIVENAGGSIWFESNESEGTSFFVSLPASGGELD